MPINLDAREHIGGKVVCRIPFGGEYDVPVYTRKAALTYRIIKLDDPVGQCGFASVNGDIVLSSEWDAAYDFTANMLARVEVDGQYGFVDTTGAYVIEPQWEYADDFVDAGGQWVAAVYKYSESEVIWKGFINEANELIGEISY